MNEDKELPVGWIETTLGEIRTDLSTGIVPNNFPEQFFELYSVPSFDTQRPEIVHGKDVGSNKQVIETGTVLLCKINPRINRAWVVGSYSNLKKIASTEWIPFFEVEGIVSGYLCYYLSSNTVRDYLAAHASGVGGSLMRINPNTISEYPFPLAPINEQYRIVATIEQQFTRLDAGVEALKQAQKKLKLYRSAILKAAVEGKLTEDWRAKHPVAESATTLLTRILKERRAKWEADQLAKMAARGVVPRDDKWKEGYKEPAQPDIENLPELPEGWCWATLEQCSNRITDGTHQPPEFTASGIPFIFVTHIVRGSISFENTKHISEVTYERLNARCPVEYGDILYSAVGSYGVAVPVLTHKPFSFQRHIAHIKPSRHVHTSYIVSCLNSSIGLNQAHQFARGVAQKTVTLSDLAIFVIPLAPIVEQEQIITLVEEQLSVISKLETMVEASLKQAEWERQSILQEAFAGRLVSQNPEDEPASVLLERIRKEREGREREKREAKKQRGSKKVASQRTTTNKQRKPLREVLKEAKEPITPDDLFKRAGFQVNDVDDFFADLREEVIHGGIKQVRPDDTYVLLEAVGE